METNQSGGWNANGARRQPGSIRSRSGWPGSQRGSVLAAYALVLLFLCVTAIAGNKFALLVGDAIDHGVGCAGSIQIGEDQLLGKRRPPLSHVLKTWCWEYPFRSCWYVTSEMFVHASTNVCHRVLKISRFTLSQ